MDSWKEEMEKEFQVIQGLVVEAGAQGAKRERERILAILARLHDSEYEEIMTHDDLIELIQEENS